MVLNFLLRSKIHHSCFLLICKMYFSFRNESFVHALVRHCAVFIYTYYLANVIIFNKQYFQIKINNLQCV